MKSILLVLAVALVITVFVAVRRWNDPNLARPDLNPVHSMASRNAGSGNGTSSPISQPRVVDISGPLKDRKIVSMILPQYPDGAEHSGIAGDVTAKIWVHPDGKLGPVIQATRLSNDAQLDDAALEALKQWRFAAIPNAVGDQWGEVTFHFRLMYPAPREHGWAQTAQPLTSPRPLQGYWH